MLLRAIACRRQRVGFSLEIETFVDMPLNSGKISRQRVGFSLEIETRGIGACAVLHKASPEGWLLA